METKTFITNLLKAYQEAETNNKLTPRFKYRIAAGLDAALVLVGALRAGQPLPYKQYKTRCLFWHTTRTETYEQCVLRLAVDYLKKEGLTV